MAINTDLAATSPARRETIVRAGQDIQIQILKRLDPVAKNKKAWPSHWGAGRVEKEREREREEQSGSPRAVPDARLSFAVAEF